MAFGLGGASPDGSAEPEETAAGPALGAAVVVVVGGGAGEVEAGVVVAGVM
jgi:hypothetical protein